MRTRGAPGGRRREIREGQIFYEKSLTGKRRLLQNACSPVTLHVASPSLRSQLRAARLRAGRRLRDDGFRDGRRLRRRGGGGGGRAIAALLEHPLRVSRPQLAALHRLDDLRALRAAE